MSDWNKWKYRLVLAACVWLLLATVLTVERYNHYSSETMLARIWEAAGDVILLTWVEKYQTLLAGLAALAGGAAVIWAAKLQTIENFRAYQRSEVQGIKDDLTIAHHLTALLAIANTNYDKRPFDLDRKVHTSINKCSPDLGVLYYIFMLKVTHPSIVSDINGIKAEAYTLTLIFKHLLDGLSANPLLKFPLSPNQWQLNHESLSKIAINHSIPVDELSPYTRYFSYIPSTPPADDPEPRPKF